MLLLGMLGTAGARRLELSGLRPSDTRVLLGASEELRMEWGPEG